MNIAFGKGFFFSPFLIFWDSDIGEHLEMIIAWAVKSGF